MTDITKMQDRNDMYEFVQLGISQFIPAFVADKNVLLFVAKGEKYTIDDAEQHLEEAAYHFGVDPSEICIVEIVFTKDNFEILEILEQSKPIKRTSVH